MKFLTKRVVIFLLFILINVLFIVSSRENTSFFTTFVLTSTNFIRSSTAFTVKFIGNTISSLKTNKKLRIENAELEQKIVQYQSHYLSVDSLLFENKKLRELLQFKYSVDFNLLPSKILALSSENGSMHYVIDKGQTSDIQRDYIVCAIYDKRLVLIGKIIETQLNTSIFKGIHERDFSIPIISSNSELLGILLGRGHSQDLLKVIIDDIYKAKQLYVGEEIMVNQYSHDFPQGIPIGRVTNITTNDETQLIEAEVESFVTPQDLDVILVLIPKKENE